MGDNLLLLVILCGGTLVLCGSGNSDYHYNQTVSTIAFGSCNKHDRAQPLWTHILKQNPDVWVWLGDAVYTDTRIVPFVWMSSSLESMKDKFDKQKQIPDYKKLLDSGVPVVGTWDDHDYGRDGAGKTFHYRFQSQNLFLDFLEEPVDSPLRSRMGIYSSHSFGTGDKIVKLIVLDVRSHYDNSWGCDVLGDEQWTWLEQQLSDPTPNLVLVGTGKQVLSDIPFIDKWMSCSASLDRLIWLAQRRPNVVFLSGDVHFSEVNCLNASSTGYPLYEVTSSGLTHSCSASLLPSGVCDWTLKNVVASRYRVSNVVTDKSFGTVKMDWSAKPVKVVFELMGVKGVQSSFTISVDDLKVRREPSRCPGAVEQPNYYAKRAFWCTVISGGIISLLIFLRISFLSCRWIALRLLKDLDAKIKRRIKKIKLMLTKKNTDKTHTD